MKYLITSYKKDTEKKEIENKGLYCYDLRQDNEEEKIATIEQNVLVNRIGSIITDEELEFNNQRNCNDFIDFDEFSIKNVEVETIEQLLETEEKINENICKDDKCIIEIGKRNNDKVALVEHQFRDGTKEYIIAFHYEVNDKKLEWGYGYYYGNNLKKAKEDFERVKAGGNLADTFKIEKNLNDEAEKKEGFIEQTIKKQKKSKKKER